MKEMIQEYMEDRPGAGQATPAGKFIIYLTLNNLRLVIKGLQIIRGYGPDLASETSVFGVRSPLVSVGIAHLMDNLLFLQEETGNTC